jgi:hypothetical protein
MVPGTCNIVPPSTRDRVETFGNLALGFRQLLYQPRGAPPRLALFFVLTITGRQLPNWPAFLPLGVFCAEGSMRRSCSAFTAASLTPALAALTYH